MKGGIMRFLISGFGTNMAALQALGIMIAISIFGFWLAWKIIAFIIDLIRGPRPPQLKSGKYQVVITNVGSDPKAVKKQLLEFNGMTKSWANRLIEGKEKVMVTAASEMDADDVKVIMEECGATVEVQPMQK